jgi:hypothetical protein
MTIRKVQAGRVITVTSTNFVGEFGTLFYEESLGDIRISDGVTPGGRLIAGEQGTQGDIGPTGPAGPQGPAGPKGDTGTQINRVIDIPDVYSATLSNGSLLVYNEAANRWDTKIYLNQQDIDAGEF